MCEDKKRKDDAFMRRVVWTLLTLVITTVGGWIWTLSSIQTQVTENTKRVEKLEENRDLLIEIKGIVGRTSSDVKQLTITQKTFGKEQALRTQTIIDSNTHMKNRRIHK